MHPSAYKDAERFVRQYVVGYHRVLDVGSLDVNGCLRPLFNHCDYVGADISKGKNVDIRLANPYLWKEIESESFDVVVSSQVLEHVPCPWSWMPEITRVLRPYGLVYVCSPNTMPYHAYPVDCWRVWPDGMKALMEFSGLQVVECYMVGRDTTGIARKPID